MIVWHKCYGHPGYDNLKLLHRKSMIIDMNVMTKDQATKDCESCTFGKQTCQSFPKKRSHQYGGRYLARRFFHSKSKHKKDSL